LIEVYENKNYPIGPAIVRVRCISEHPPGSCPSKRSLIWACAERTNPIVGWPRWVARPPRRKDDRRRG
jgi:hypothetical protein